LIETGFLTNPKEEKWLSDSTTQIKMAGAMFTAFEKYKNELEGVDVQTENTESLTDETSANDNTTSVDVVFRIQIETSGTKISLTDSRFKGNTMYEYKQDGLYKYTTGYFPNDFDSANKLKSTLRNDGFQHAFVVGFLNGERISLQKAINLAEK